MRPEGEPDADPDVLAIRTLGAPRAGTRRRRSRLRFRDAGPRPAAAELPLGRLTVIRARPFESTAQAGEWLDRVRAERGLWEPLLAEAAAIVNRALHAHRTAAADPYVADVDPARALAVRFGYGSGEEVAEGRWRSAVELEQLIPGAPRGRDVDALAPQERVAAVLGARERVAPYEELILRARADLDAGRLGSAALGLHAALEAIAALEGAPASGAGDAGPSDEATPALAGAGVLARDARRRVLEGAPPDADALGDALKAAETFIHRSR